MKRKQKEQTLFFWETRKSRKQDESDTDFDNETKSSSDRPQIELLLVPANNYEQSIPLPYEMLMKIFTSVIELSNNPLRDLCSLARVCETWRQIVLQSPSLWTHIDLSELPITDRNVSVLDRIFKNNNNSIRENIREVSFYGNLECKSNKTSSFIEDIICSPQLTTLSFRDLKIQNRTALIGIISRSISKCKNLQSLTLSQSRILFNNQKWLADHLIENGRHLESLNLAMSLTSISSQLFRAIGTNYCPNLKVLDISTCDALSTHSFDAIQLTQNVPNLTVLRVGNVSFKRVYGRPPNVKGLVNLKELSMPIGMRDADRDDALFATLTFSSDEVVSLDLRGSSITPHALLEMPSYHVRELHIDDLCPINRADYHSVIKKWADTLRVLSMVKINCSETIKGCLKVLSKRPKKYLSILRELDLSSSHVTTEDLRQFLSTAPALELINLTSCRSLPRGCKGVFAKKPLDRSTQKLSELKRKLKK